jgi:hypothetical protein
VARTSWIPFKSCPRKFTGLCSQETQRAIAQTALVPRFLNPLDLISAYIL